MNTRLGHDLIELICRIGLALGFEVAKEVEASEAAWVDVVWFDSRLSPESFGVKRPRIRRHPVLPVVGFEVEVKTGLNAKHVKGSVSNLNNLCAQLGIIAIGSSNLDLLRSRKPHMDKREEDLERLLLERVYRWVYAESQPAGRIVVMSERELIAWAGRLGVEIPAPKQTIEGGSTMLPSEPADAESSGQGLEASAPQGEAGQGS